MLNFILLLILGLILGSISLRQVGKKLFLAILGTTITVFFILNIFVNTYNKVADVRIYVLLLFIFVAIGTYINRKH